MKEREIPSNIACISIEDLKLSIGTKKRLMWNRINTLGQLLELDSEQLLKIRKLGEKMYIEIRDCVHELGYELKNEWIIKSEIIAQKKEAGIKLLEDYGLSSNVYSSLYSNGIYTMEDVCNYGNDVLKLKQFGPLRQQELLSKMSELGVEFKNEKETIVVKPETNQNTLLEDINETKLENSKIKDRISKKLELVQLYKSLLLEQKELLLQEQELDMEITNLNIKSNRCKRKNI